MAFYAHGTKKVPIRADELLVRCPACEAAEWADVMVWSNCYHIYWLPVFPYEKEADIVCKNCGLKRYGRSFDAQLFSNFHEVEDNFRHPLIAYTGCAVLAIFLLCVAAVKLSQ